MEYANGVTRCLRFTHADLGRTHRIPTVWVDRELQPIRAVDRFFPCLILLVLSLAVSVHAETLEALDRIVARASSLDDFLAKPDLVEEYFKGMQAYYGAEHMPRDAFDKLMGQLRDIKEKVPGLKDRLWETNGLGTEFSISSAVKTYGRRLEREKWETAHRDLLTALSEGSAPAGKNVDQIVAAQAKRLTEAEAAWAKMKRADADRARGEFYRELRENPEANAAAAALAHRLLSQEEIKDKLTSGDADLVLDTVKALREKTRELTKHDPGPLLSLMLEKFPRVDQLLNDSSVFPVATKTTNQGKQVPVGTGANDVTYNFKPLPRRFHGIFKGIPLKECVGSGSGQLTAQRWATVALKDSQLYVLERESGGTTSYDGFVQHVPLKNKKGEIVASTDFGAPALRNKFVVTNRVTGKPSVYSVYDLWLDAFTKQMPKEWKGLAVGDSRAINNAGVIDDVRASASYAMGVRLGPATDFRHIDAMVPGIVANSHKDSYNYGGNMILDGTVRDAGNLLMLEPQGEMIARDPKFLREIMSGSDMDRKLRVMDYVRRGNGVSSEAQAELAGSPAYPHLLAWDGARNELNAYIAGTRVGRRDRALAALLMVGSGAVSLATQFLPEGTPVWPTFGKTIGAAVFASSAITFFNRGYPRHFLSMFNLRMRMSAQERLAGSPGTSLVAVVCKNAFAAVFSRTPR